MKKHKFPFKFLLKAIVIIALTSLFVLPNTGCFVDGKFLNGNINLALYTNEGQMQRLISDLDCDTSSMISENGNIIRLAHNNGEPIYVSFEDNIPDDIKETCIQSLDYIFGLVGEINSYYYYEIVECDKYVSTKSNIRYSLYNEATSNIKNASAYVERISKRSYYTTNNVCINQNLLSRNENYKFYVLTHELLHIFGFEDVYVSGKVKNTSEYFDNTFLNVSDIYINSGMISPNDYKFLLSAYSTKNVFSNYNSVINNYQMLINDYSSKFYNAVAQASLKNNIGNLTQTDLTNIKMASSGGEVYELSINGSDYLLKISINGNTKETLNGKLETVEVKDDGTAILILTDINSKLLANTGKFSTSEAVHTNLMLYSQINNNLQQEYYLSKLSGGKVLSTVV